MGPTPPRPLTTGGLWVGMDQSELRWAGKGVAWLSPGVCQFHGCSVWVQLCFHHWLINQEKHKQRESKQRGSL